MREQISTLPIKKCDTIIMPFLIVTQNLIMRPILKQDKNEIMQAVRDSLQNLQMWLPWADTAPMANEFVNLTNKFFQEAQEQLAYHFVVYQNEKFMGMCSLIEVDLQKGSAQLGYWCRNNIDNSNYFIEAINGLLRYFFENTTLPEVLIDCVVGNFVSESAAKELNFKLQSVDLVNGNQIKRYKIDGKDKLPELSAYSVVN